MINNNLRKDVLFSSYRALIGNVTKNMSLISIRWTENSYHIRVFLDTVPNEEDVEVVQEITTMICADLPFIEFCKEEVFIKSSNNELLDETIFWIRG